jgi:hypothetical protein
MAQREEIPINHLGFRPQKRLAFVMLVLTGLVLGCSAAPPSSSLYVNERVYLQTWYPYLQEGKTTKAGVESELGRPSQLFENGRIWTYQLIGSRKAEENPQYSLVLVFDDKGVLRQHRLIRIRDDRM